ncbi:MAG: PEP/pyruvate-binding domain-containing protein, partial [Acidobacteriota bacterium]
MSLLVSSQTLVTEVARSEARAVERFGGKAVSLARLQAFGLAVPPFFVITADAYRLALDAADLRGAEPAVLHRRLLDIELPPGLGDDLARACRFTFDDGAWLAVRSSGLEEDGDDASFAGVHDSFLFVRGRRRLLDAVRRVWASVHGPRATAYRTQRGLPPCAGVAVVIQRMVRAERSGVLFTADPGSGDVHRQVVGAVYGAGEGLVGRGFAADTFSVTKGTKPRIVDRRIEVKDQMLVHNPSQ